MLSGIPDTGINTGIRAQWRYTGICDHYRYHTGIPVYRYRSLGIHFFTQALAHRPVGLSIFCTLQIMAAVESLLNDAPATSADPIEIQQPFAASTCYYIPKTAISPVWKVGFRCRSDQDYKKDGALVFCTNDKCKNSASLPVGHKHEFPVFRKWKSGDSNQIMLIHCRREHKDEFDAIGSKTQASVASSASRQKDLTTMMKTKSAHDKICTRRNKSTRQFREYVGSLDRSSS